MQTVEEGAVEVGDLVIFKERCSTPNGDTREKGEGATVEHIYFKSGVPLMRTQQVWAVDVRWGEGSMMFVPVSHLEIIPKGK